MAILGHPKYLPSRGELSEMVSSDEETINTALEELIEDDVITTYSVENPNTNSETEFPTTFWGPTEGGIKTFHEHNYLQMVPAQQALFDTSELTETMKQHLAADRPQLPQPIADTLTFNKKVSTDADQPSADSDEEFQSRFRSIEEMVIAYLYESKIVEGVASGGSWTTQITTYHPDTINNTQYRNLQRLVTLDVVNDEPKPVGFMWVKDEAPHERSINVTKRFLKKSITDERDQITRVKPLVPIPEDRGDGPDPEPLRPKYNAFYFKQELDDDGEAFYRVDQMEDKAEVVTTNDDAKTPNEIEVAKVMYHLLADEVDEIPYEKTPFAEPKYRHSLTEWRES